MLRVSKLLPLLAGIALFAGSGAATAQTEDTGWQPLAQDNARLYIDPAAFGTQGIQRLERTADNIRYEMWRTPFDFSLRVFQTVLFEPQIPGLAPETPTLRELISQMLRNVEQSSINWQDTLEVVTGVSLADVQLFQLNGETGCAGFRMVLPQGARFLSHGVYGLYCDPAFSTLPRHDVEETLKLIGVVDIFIPG